MTSYEQWQKEKHGNVIPESEPALENDTTINLPNETILLASYDKEVEAIIIQQ